MVCIKHQVEDRIGDEVRILKIGSHGRGGLPPQALNFFGCIGGIEHDVLKQFEGKVGAVSEEPMLIR